MNASELTFYGHFTGWSSYATVSKALASYLQPRYSKLVLCDLRPQGAYDMPAGMTVEVVDEAVREGIRQRALHQQLGGQPALPQEPGTSLLFAFPTWAGAIPRHERVVGYHVCDCDRVPPVWVHYMNQEDLVLTPSLWCKSAFEASGVTTPIQVVPHGVSLGKSHQSYAFHVPEGGPAVRHFCSAEIDPSRKGSLEVIEAWKNLDPRGWLFVHTDNPAIEAAIKRTPRAEVVKAPPRNPAEMAALYASTDLLVAPSRGEGFGLMPLEALCLGRPVVATTCTGHAMFMDEDTPGLEPVFHGELAACGGGRAPRVTVQAVEAALGSGLEKLANLRHAAETHAAELTARWGWETVLTRFDFARIIAST